MNMRELRFRRGSPLRVGKWTLHALVYNALRIDKKNCNEHDKRFYAQLSALNFLRKMIQDINFPMKKTIPYSLRLSICDRTWEKGPLRALLQNRVIGIQG